jgi:putative PIN family toxin of toxin-antitoxin system
MNLWQTLSRLFASIVRQPPRVVLDTNILISATLAEHGFSAKIFRAARHQKIRVIISEYILTEYSNVMRRPHIAKKYRGIDLQVDAVIRFLNVRATIVAPHKIEPIIPADPKDGAILACAIQGNAKYIVSGDEHLLQLGSYRGIKILSPRDFAITVLPANIPDLNSPN